MADVYNAYDSISAGAPRALYVCHCDGRMLNAGNNFCWLFSQCLSVCLCRVFLSRLWSKLVHMLHVRV